MIKLKARTREIEPIYSTENAAGCDVYVDSVKKAYTSRCKEVPQEVIDNLNQCLKEKGYFYVRKDETVLIGTGLTIEEMPDNYEIQVRPRSSVSLKRGFTTHFGTIDPDYRDEIGVIITNRSGKKLKVERFERIAQLVISKFERIQVKVKSEKRKGGFGSTN